MRQELASLRPSGPSIILPAAVGVAIVAIGFVSLLRTLRAPRVSDEVPQALAETGAEHGSVPSHEAVVKAARRLNTACGVLALSVFADSGIEHWRGSFHNRAMYLPLAISGLTIGISLHGTSDERPAAHLVRDVAYGLAAGTAVVGAGFHVYNVGKRPGGFSWLNLFYGAPIGAPWALLLTGVFGLYSERIRDQAAETPRVNPHLNCSDCLPGGRLPFLSRSALSGRWERLDCCISAAPTTIPRCSFL